MSNNVLNDQQLLEILREELFSASGDFSEQSFEVRGIWNFSLRYQPDPNERLFRHYVILCQSIGEGICYLDNPIEVDDSLLGADARNVNDYPFEVQVSVLDSVFAGLRPENGKRYIISGDHSKKAADRAKIVAKTAHQILKRKGNSRIPLRVLNIGAIGLIIQHLREFGYVVNATDLDPRIIGTLVGETKVLDGFQNLELIPEYDLVIASGMTLATQTMVQISNQCKEFNIPCVIVAETGANLAPYYKKILGLAAVVSEPFPFYTFSSTSEIYTYID